MADDFISCLFHSVANPGALLKHIERRWPCGRHPTPQTKLSLVVVFPRFNGTITSEKEENLQLLWLRRRPHHVSSSSSSSSSYSSYWYLLPFLLLVLCLDIYIYIYLLDHIEYLI